MAEAKSILVVDDDQFLAELLCRVLRAAGYTCDQATSGESALASVTREPPDLVVLDRGLPGMSGDDVVRRLRSDPRSREIPVIMLSGMAEEDDELIGFALGADDYVSKPFSMKLLLARISAKLRARDGADPNELETPPRSIVLDKRKSRVLVDQVATPLERVECQLLAALLVARGHVLRREQLCRVVHGETKDPGTDAELEGYITALRRKLGPAGWCLQPVGSDGWVFCVPAGVSRTTA